MAALQRPAPQSLVFKEECCFSFDSPFSDTGLFVNLQSFQAVGQRFLHADALRSHCRVHLLLQYSQEPKNSAGEDTSADVEKDVERKDDHPTKLAIGVDGGFDLGPKYTVEKKFYLSVFLEEPTKENKNSCPREIIPLPFKELKTAPDIPSGIVEVEANEEHIGMQIPEFLRSICLAILNHEGMGTRMQLDTWEADSEIFESKYAKDLEQLDNGKKISNDPSEWKCEMSGDKSNLWLNLSTGYIGGGRKFWDGSGGSGAALQHFEDTGKRYPLCVKLGTITQHGADVWSYADDEDSLVKDPLLAEHLSHWGIDIMKLEKTEKTLGETELEKNLRYDWSKILEKGEELTPLSGAGLKGLVNIGSSCYMSSVFQTFFSIPEVQEKYFSSEWAKSLADNYSSASSPAFDLSVQLVKLGSALLSDRYVDPAANEHEDMTLLGYQVAPRMIKYLIGKGHREFSSCRQQDASEFFQYFLQVLEREEHKQPHPSSTKTNSLFSFDLEERYECDVTKQVRYVCGQKTRQNVLELRIPVDDCDDSGKDKESTDEVLKRQKLDGDAAVKPVPFSSCLEEYFKAATVDIRNPSLGSAPSTATKTAAFSSFPKYLMVKLGRYYVDKSWSLKKIDRPVDVPEELDLTSHLRIPMSMRNEDGLLPGETAIPEETSKSNASGEPEPNPDIVAQLVAMGFSENGSKRATVATHNSNAEMAMGWVLEHMEDPDFNDPLPQHQATAGSEAVTYNPEHVMTLSSFGYSEQDAQAALKATDHNMERAADWLFSHPDDLQHAVAQVLGASSNARNSDEKKACDPEIDSKSLIGKYHLMAIISHMGSSTECGHYVAHVKKGGRWVLFNDEKVAESKSTPFKHGYMYLYARND